MPNNKLVLHLVDEAVIYFSWLGGGEEIFAGECSEKVPIGGWNIKVLRTYEL